MSETSSLVADAKPPKSGALCPLCKAGVFLGLTVHAPSCKWAGR